MLPLRDNIGEGGAPVSALVLIGLITAAGFVIPGGGWLPALVALAAAWVYVPTPVRRFGPLPTAALTAVCGAIGGWLATLAGEDPGLWAGPAAAAGAAGLHLLTNRDARVMGLVAIPFRSGFWEIGSATYATSWAGAALVLVVIL